MAFVPIDQLPETAQSPWMAMMVASNGGPAGITAVRRTIEAKYPRMILQFSTSSREFTTIWWATA